jgi:hypothetical protein
VADPRVQQALQEHQARLDALREVRRSKRAIQAELSETRRALAESEARSAAAAGPRITDGARLSVGGRVPTPADIARMTDAEANLLLRRFGVGQDRVELVSAALERASQRLVGAEAPSTALVDATMAAAERAVRRELRVAAKELTRQYQTREMGVGDDTPERWQAVMDKATCNDCEARHGEVQPHAAWVQDGEPGSRNLVCNGQCRCLLVPDAAFDGAYERGDVKVSITLEVDG